jgi:hypothetical protein
LSCFGFFAFFVLGVLGVVVAATWTAGVVVVVRAGVVTGADTGAGWVSVCGCGAGCGCGVVGCGCGTGCVTTGGVGGAASSSGGGFPFDTGIDVSGDGVVVTWGSTGRWTTGVAGAMTGREITGRAARDVTAGFGCTFLTTCAVTTGACGVTGEETAGTAMCCCGAEGSCTAIPTATTPTAVEASGSKVAARCRRSIASDC